jgi:tRNA(fMet)-specific endonuclease VapC
VGVLIDASVLIAWERGIAPGQALSDREHEDAFLSVITVSELLHGVHRADDRVRRAHRSAFVEGLLDRFRILSIDLPAARMHAEIRASMQGGGQVVGAHDLWLAASALAHGLAVVTRNLREFEQVPGLTVEKW